MPDRMDEKEIFANLATEFVKAKAWYGHLPTNLSCHHVSFSYGERICSSGSAEEEPSYPFATSEAMKELMRNSIGVVLEGRIEICDESRFSVLDYDHVISSRPIRILRPGDIFGLFSIADKLIEPIGGSRPGETWAMFSGGRSTIVASNPSDTQQFIDNREYMDDDKAIENPNYEKYFPSAFVSKYVSKAYRTKIAVVEFSKSMTDDVYLMRELLTEAWRQAQIYRLGINSYNFSELMYFRNLSMDIYSKLRKKDFRGDEYSKGYVKTILPAFIDGLFDIVNRPVRNEPLYCRAQSASDDSAIEFDETFDGACKAIDLTTADILLAANADRGGTFYYPIDYNNYMLNFQCAKNTSKEKNCIDVFGKSRSPNVLETNLRKLYIALSTRILSTYKSRRKLGYNITIQEFDSVHNKVIMAVYDIAARSK